ncbi:DUF4240 domain-containing protein [Motiliproteus coralliicola]|uniref:DUF4240 domain-containing protein n=1 Tax=Motiliproteus coralliicola TaxID=2283196 RepID=A0A369WNF4_9GAMM|nr:DUF4240 domain-containing protein [Motiliproteus coralliicola]RDE23031.1 DUF4240 domain-containing protein [Motiliproteus coralliicola]
MENRFWEVIESVKEKSGEDWESRPELLKEALLKMTPDEVIAFNNTYFSKLTESYRWDLWGAAYVLNGGCSDDMFDYWRAFLISEGKAIFEKALSTPDSLSELDDIEEAELEEFSYAIDDAYETLTGNEIPSPESKYPESPVGDRWEEDDLPNLLPRLCEKYEYV